MALRRLAFQDASGQCTQLAFLISSDKEEKNKELVPTLGIKIGHGT
jgi:hypothetical protein